MCECTCTLTSVVYYCDCYASAACVQLHTLPPVVAFALQDVADQLLASARLQLVAPQFVPSMALWQSVDAKQISPPARLPTELLPLRRASWAIAPHPLPCQHLV